ncbi:helix-turn-helix domain-containing protein [Acetobacterium carbinolicum]|uniref:helix-turn-helix domain-containing protein n=1 Tax=Acetobacterium carbinolicum TaxID=52690 RepID=UPI003BF4A7D1
MNLPFRREKLAHYLSADRSAISRELMRMEKDGLIQVTRNQIALLYMLSPPN